MENKSLSILHSLHVLCPHCVLGTVRGAGNTALGNTRVLARGAHALVDSR